MKRFLGAFILFLSISTALQAQCNLPDCQGRSVSEGYTIVTKKLSSNAAAAKKYTIAQVFKERGKPEKVSQIYDEIIKEFPNSLEAAYVQLNLMLEELNRYRQNTQYNEPFLKAVLAINSAYQSENIYNELKVSTLNWLTELVEDQKSVSRYDEGVYQGVILYTSTLMDTKLTEYLKKVTTAWMIKLGEMELLKTGGTTIARTFFDKAEKIGISDTEAKNLNDKIRAAGIYDMINKGNKDEAEMAIVEWEVEKPDSPLLIKLKKEFYRPTNMVTIPSGKVRGYAVETFNLDKYETTNEEFLEFVKANPEFRRSMVLADFEANGKATLKKSVNNDDGYLRRWNDDYNFDVKLKNVPVVFVSQIIATNYCNWKGKRLPTNLEWGLAAGEGKRNFPWGDQMPTNEIANFQKGFLGDPMPGDAHPKGATPEGVMQMGGNVWEFTSTIVNGQVIARGGCYYDPAETLRNDNKRHTSDAPAYSSRFSGFRCAK